MSDVVVKNVIVKLALAAAVSAATFAAFSWAAYRIGLAYHVSEFVAVTFGRPSSPYSFRNLVVPRMLALMVTAMPSIPVGLLGYRMLSSGKLQFRLVAIFVGIGVVAVLLGLLRGDALQSPLQPWRAAFFVAYCLAVSVACTWCVFRQYCTF